jgi:hypothetical protein
VRAGATGPCGDRSFRCRQPLTGRKSSWRPPPVPVSIPPGFSGRALACCGSREEWSTRVLVFFPPWGMDCNRCLHLVGLDTGSLHSGFLHGWGGVSRWKFQWAPFVLVATVVVSWFVSVVLSLICPGRHLCFSQRMLGTNGTKLPPPCPILKARDAESTHAVFGINASPLR